MKTLKAELKGYELVDGEISLKFKVISPEIFETSKWANEVQKTENGKNSTCKRYLRLEVSEWKDKRSLDANAYFHVLVNKLARFYNTSDSEVKQRLVVDYGVLAKDKNGMTVCVMLPSSANIEDFYEYARLVKTKEVNGTECNVYVFYKRTSEMDSKEMTVLIEGAIDECKEANEQGAHIEYLTPDEVAKMCAEVKDA